MKKIKYILITFFFGCMIGLHAQHSGVISEKRLADTLHIGYQIDNIAQTSSYSISGVNNKALEKSSFVDVGKALYGKIAGLNVYQGSGSSPDNVSRLSIHGRTPLVLIDGFPRDIEDITSLEIESIYVLKDAASTALYGMQGGNGVVVITTKRGANSKLKINIDYNFGINSQFRAPEFADSYTYAQSLNNALERDGLPMRYNSNELEAFRDGTYPYEYPNINWWNQTLNKSGYTNNLKLSFNGGNNRFRYFTVIDYYRDHSMLKQNSDDKRYNTSPTDTRLSLRTNIDVDITETTYLKAGLVGKLNEINGTRFGRNNIFNPIYKTPSAAFPVRYENGIYGGSSVYGAENPVAILKDYGHSRYIRSTLLADLTLKQELDVITEGLFADVSVSFDNIGAMSENSVKGYRYMNLNPRITDKGTLITTPQVWGKDSETLNHNQPFESLLMRSNFVAKLGYDNLLGRNHFNAFLIYDMQSSIREGRNNTLKNQSLIANASYTYDNRYSISGVLNYSGSAYLPDGDKFRVYPAASAAWIVSNEKFLKNSNSINLLKIRASYGLSGWDRNLWHELWRQSYISGSSNYFFGNVSGVNGNSEGNLPVVGLTVEKLEKTTLGIDFVAFKNRLSATIEGFSERRSDILISGSNSTSGIIGIGIGNTNEGINHYKGFDISLNWNDKLGDFGYGIGATASYLNSEIINDNQEFQQYDYLYRKGNRVGQMYGLEAIGFFESQIDINNSPLQTFSTVSPGDIKYKDQNNDNRIDEKDIVKMFGSSIPRFYFGFSINLSYKRFELLSDFQGLTGYTVSLLNSPLYKPLVGNGNISTTFLNNEIPWTPENKAVATMPRLTTVDNSNNYRASSVWYRDGSFIKLRNLMIAYTLPKNVTNFVEMKLFLQGNNLFSLDNIGFADPEQLQVAYPSVKSYWAGIKLNF